MAIIYNKGKELKYTGFDKVQKSFGDALEKIKSTASRGVSAVKNNRRDYNRAQAQKELDNVSRAFGNVENYEKLNPSFKKRRKKLMDIISN